MWHLLRRGLTRTNTFRLILINFFVFLVGMILSIFLGDKFLQFTAMQPSSIFAGEKVWTIFTSMFVHAGIGHLFANLLSLLFIGMFLEKIIGKKRFLILYLLSGLFAGLFYSSLSFFFGNTEMGARIFGSPDVLALGASGAIFGLLGLLAVLTPRNRIYLIAGPLFAIIVQAVVGSIVPNKEILDILNLVVTIYFVFCIFAILSFSSRLRRLTFPIEMPFWVLPIVAIVPLVIIGLFVPLPIGNTGHLGGLIVGLIYGLYLRKNYPNKTRMIEKQFSR